MKHILLFLFLLATTQSIAQTAAFDRFLGYSSLSVAALKAKFNKPGWTKVADGFNKTRNANELKFENVIKDNITGRPKQLITVSIEYRNQNGHESILSVGMTSNDKSVYSESLTAITNKVTGTISKKRFTYVSAVNHAGWVGNRYLDTENGRTLYIIQVPAVPASFYVGYYAPNVPLAEVSRLNVK